MTKILLLSLTVLLTGCFGSNTIPPNPWPNDADLQDCDYPLPDKLDLDTDLADVYLMALGEIEVCNSRLSGVRKAKEEYKKLVED